MSNKVGDYRAHKWINGSGTVGGHPALVRKNIGVGDVEPSEYPNLVLVSLLYKDVAADGRPANEEEWARLDDTEERIADAMCERRGAAFVLCVTRNGKRDLFFYLGMPISDADAEALIESIVPSVDYEIERLIDPHWRPYRALLPDPPQPLH